MLAQAKSRRRHWRIALLLGSAESAAADFSQALLMVSYFALMKVLLPVHVDVKWGLASLWPAFMGGLSPVLYQLIVLARHTQNGQIFGVRLKFHWF